MQKILVLTVSVVGLAPSLEPPNDFGVYAGKPVENRFNQADKRVSHTFFTLGCEFIRQLMSKPQNPAELEKIYPTTLLYALMVSILQVVSLSPK